MVQHAFSARGTEKKNGKYDPIIFKWLADLNSSLDSWNTARKELGQTKPDKRNKIDKAIQDIIDNFPTRVEDDVDLNSPNISLYEKYETLYVMDPRDMSSLPGLSMKAMEMTQLEIGIDLGRKLASNKDLPKENEPKKAIQSYATVTAKKKMINNNKKELIRGHGKPLAGSKPMKIGLHIKLPNGSKLETLQNDLSKRKLVKAQNIKFTKLSQSINFSTYQLVCEVDIAKRDFWRGGDFWPVGCLVRRWKGKLDLVERNSISKRLEIIGIKSDVTTARITNHIKSKIYDGITFKSFKCGQIDNGKLFIDLEVGLKDGNALFNLHRSLYPDGITVKWLKGSKLKKAKVVDWL